ncbi:MAG: CRISPR-associated protein Cas5 [Nitrospinota bacterium]
MFAFTVKAFACTASFRVPECHTFQITLPLPPVTTLTGLMGAAMGLSFEKAMEFREQEGIRFGVIGSYEGEMRDLWKYNKVKSGETLKDVLIREYLTDYSLTIIIGSEKRNALSQVRDGFEKPRYALTAGNSDDLLKICNISNIKIAETTEMTDFENTILSADEDFQYDPSIDLKTAPITESIRAPQVHLLPVSFTFKGEERRVSKREQFFFVVSPIKLKKPVPAYNVDHIGVVLL